MRLHTITIVLADGDKYYFTWKDVGDLPALYNVLDQFARDTQLSNFSFKTALQIVQMIATNFPSLFTAPGTHQ